MTAADGPAGSANGRVLLLPDAPSLADLATFVGRARRADPDGAARLRGLGDVLAVYVSPLHGGGGPTVLGLRTLALARPSELDVTVPLASLLDRFAREPGAGPAPGYLANPSRRYPRAAETASSARSRRRSTTRWYASETPWTTPPAAPPIAEALTGSNPSC